MNTNTHKSRPWHLWTVGILGLLWNLGGAIDFVMTQSKNAAYLEQFTPEQLEFFLGFPVWLVVLWAIAVWGGVFGCILLLLQLSISRWVFMAALDAFIIVAVYNYAFSIGMEIMGSPGIIAFNAIIFLVASALVGYSFAMHKKGMLR